jgi:cephalosporin hydroxylase
VTFLKIRWSLVFLLDPCEIQMDKSPIDQFYLDCAREIELQGNDEPLRLLSREWFDASARARYSYHFESLGRPIIAYPQDMVAMQELIWRVRPDLIIETGIAHGGSMILNASMLALVDYCDAVETGQLLDPRNPRRRVIGIDVDIRAHNRQAIDSHPLANRIHMIQGSSIDPSVVSEVHRRAASFKRILVALDSNHTHDHVLAELEAYAPLVTLESFCVVFDTVIEDMPPGSFPDRAWDKGNNPKTAVWEYLKSHSEFESDRSIDNKLLISGAPEGFLKRIA